MNEHSKETEHYRHMVKENPEHAVKTIMCRKMIQHEEIRELATRLQPLVRQWVSETPGLHERLVQKLNNVKPFYANLAYVEEALNTASRQRPSLPSPDAVSASKIQKSISPG